MLTIPTFVLDDYSALSATTFDFSRRDSLGVTIRDFPTLLKETVDWIKSEPFSEEDI